VSSPSPTLDASHRDSLSSGESFELRFFLTEAELQQGHALLHPITGTSRSLRARLICAACAVICLGGPILYGWSWPEFIQDAPVGALNVGLAALFCSWCASGIGFGSLNNRLNRLDLERHVVLSDRGVTIDWNEKTFNYQWKDFVFFRENESIVVLRNPGVRCWTIPLRTVPAGRRALFLDLLHRNLARHQPYSWSPDSSRKPR